MRYNLTGQYFPVDLVVSVLKSNRTPVYRVESKEVAQAYRKLTRLNDGGMVLNNKQNQIRLRSGSTVTRSVKHNQGGAHIEKIILTQNGENPRQLFMLVPRVDTYHPLLPRIINRVLANDFGQ